MTEEFEFLKNRQREFGALVEHLKNTMTEDPRDKYPRFSTQEDQDAWWVTLTEEQKFRYCAEQNAGVEWQEERFMKESIRRRIEQLKELGCKYERPPDSTFKDPGAFAEWDTKALQELCKLKSELEKLRQQGWREIL